jgi:hypothetical protein
VIGIERNVERKCDLRETLQHFLESVGHCGHMFGNNFLKSIETKVTEFSMQ